MNSQNLNDEKLENQSENLKSEIKEQNGSFQTDSTIKKNVHQPKVEDSLGFLVYFKGEIIGANFSSTDHIYCKYNFVYGPDWEVLNGNLENFSQIASRNRFSNKHSNLDSLFNLKKQTQVSNVWNLPFELTMSSTNVYGWPQIAISVYGLNFFGYDFIQGYGHLHLPPIPGTHELCVDLFRPKPSTILGELSEYLGGKRPEFIDFKSVTQGQGRELFRFKTEKGKVIIRVEVIIKDLNKHGYVYV